VRATLPTTHEADATHTVEASIRAELKLIPSSGTDEERFERIRAKLAKLNYRASQQESRFRAQIDVAIAAEL
jgi:selenocysteine-specific translation elongation factor